MNNELINICPICGEGNSILNKHCFKCYFDFEKQNDLYLVREVADYKKVFDDFENSFKVEIKKINQFVEIGDESNSGDYNYNNNKKKIIEKINELFSLFNNSFILRSNYLFSDLVSIKLFDKLMDTTDILTFKELLEIYNRIVDGIGKLRYGITDKEIIVLNIKKDEDILLEKLDEILGYVSKK